MVVVAHLVDCGNSIVPPQLRHWEWLKDATCGQTVQETLIPLLLELRSLQQV